MEYERMISVIEGLLFVAGDEGLDLKQLAHILQSDEAKVSQVLERMKEQFRAAGRGLQVLEVAGSYQLTTLPDHAEYFKRLAASPTRATLSQAALETLAIIAYKQPITRIEIEEIRGVKTDRAIQTLVSKSLIEPKARAEAVGRPILYGTTKEFLDYFGLNTLDDLPDAAAFHMDDNLEEETRLLFDKLEQEQPINSDES